MSKRNIVQIGDKFSRLTVVEYLGINNRKRRVWKCRCDCGNFIKVETGSLTSGNTKSCGCIKLERIKKIGALKFKHGMKNTKEYKAWEAIKQRCYNPKVESYEYYGKRGIVMCDEWKYSFEAFYRDMGKAPKGYSIDRINVDGNYCKDNCKWSNIKEQNYNKRNSIKITFNGVTENLLYWSKFTGIKARIIYERLTRGRWSAEKAITTPVRRRYCNE